MTADCENAGYSHKKHRLYCRSFNYAEARKRHAAGESVAALAREYGVQPDSVRRAVDLVFREKRDAKSTERMMSGTCSVCGKEGVARYNFRGDAPRCRSCSDRAKRCANFRFVNGIVTEVHCPKHGWLPVDRFSPQARNPERSVPRYCRACQSAQRRARRDRVKVPCARCGEPCLPASLRVTDLCRECWRDVNLRAKR